MAYDVFISVKDSGADGRPTKESRTAKELYDFLTAKGLRAFLSTVELELTGKAEFTRVIDEALDSSGILIAVGGSRDNLNARWVRYEWESFLNDIRAGIKPNAEVFVVCDGMKIHELPRALRQQQAFDAADSGVFERLYNFIRNAGKGPARRGGEENAAAYARPAAPVAAGIWHTVGLKADGTAVAAGLSKYGQCDVSGWRGMIAVAAGDGHTVGLKADGTTVAVGPNEDGKCDVSGWRGIVAVAAGDGHTVGLKADGTAVAVGDNRSGQCDVSGWRGLIAVAAGAFHTVGMKADGTAVAAGWNKYGQCGVSGWRGIGPLNAGP